jgi:hypothetical protein
VVCFLSLILFPGTRPPLPHIPLGEEYQPVIELFNSCTEEDFRRRPDAGEIVRQLEDP